MTLPAIGQLRSDKQGEAHYGQRSHLTFRGNVRSGRHGWLRLTPAYSLHVVNEILQESKSNEYVLDPFSGTGTTPLAATTGGVRAHSVDINSFLVWLGNLKLKRFSDVCREQFQEESNRLLGSLRRKRNLDIAWVPNIHKIEKWWDSETLAALSHVFAEIEKSPVSDDVRSLMRIAFCRAMIAVSNASFSHQSMSFKKPSHPNGQRMLFSTDNLVDRKNVVLTGFGEAVNDISDSIALDVPTIDGRVFLGDSRRLDKTLPHEIKYSKVITSPPYPNRMSYIRELRPYMYWLGFLSDGRQAGELDWQAIGGTWGCATSNLAKWHATDDGIPYGRFDSLVKAISNERLVLGRYVHKYFDDVKLHLRNLRKVLAPGANCYYIVGNSKFYNTILPVEEIYTALFEDAGFRECGWEVIRKRTSKKELFEYVVYAQAP